MPYYRGPPVFGRSLVNRGRSRNISEPTLVLCWHLTDRTSSHIFFSNFYLWWSEASKFTWVHILAPLKSHEAFEDSNLDFRSGTRCVVGCQLGVDKSPNIWTSTNHKWWVGHSFFTRQPFWGVVLKLQEWLINTVTHMLTITWFHRQFKFRSIKGVF